MATEAHGENTAEVAAIAAATSALEGYAFHLVAEPGDRVGSGGGDGDEPPTEDAREARDPGTFAGLNNVVLLAHSTDTFRRLARDAPRKGEVCVDVGSAHGDATKRMAKAVGSEENVIGFDVSSEFVRLAGEKYPGITFERLDILEDTTFFANVLAKKSPDCVFVDIGGVRAAEALVRALPVVAASYPRLVVVKCEALAERSKERIARAAPVAPLPTTFWPSVCASEVKAARARSSHKSQSTARNASPANTAFARYPLRYPKRFFAPSGVAAEGLVEMCRFHNYAEEGCLRLKRGTCALNHTACHWCGAQGHKASACAEAAAAAKATAAAGLAAKAVPEPESNDGTGVANRDAGPAASAGDAAYVYCVGGRNRGQTVGVVERLCLRTLTWSRGPRLNEPRGSHGVAAAGNALIAVGGGGVRSNLHDAEVLRVAQESVSSSTALTGDVASWEPFGFVAEARHAVAACATGSWGVYLIGGWGDGDSCTGAVDALLVDETRPRRARDAGSATARSEPSLTGGRGWVPSDTESNTRWRSLPGLSTPRKLHAAAGLRDGRLFVFGGRTGDDPNVGPTDSAETFDPRAPRRDEAEEPPVWKPISPLPAGGACACACVDSVDDAIVNAVYVLTWGASAKSRSRPVSSNRREKRARKAGEAARKAALARGLDEDAAVAEGNAARAAARAAEETIARQASASATAGGGQISTEAGGLWRYDADADSYAYLADLPLPEWYGFTAAAHDGYVYAIGGSTKGRWTGAAFRLRVSARGRCGETGLREWEELPSMEMVRRRAAAAVVRVKRV